MIFGLGRLFYVVLLLINSIAVLSEERFLRRKTTTHHYLPVGLGSQSNQAVFGQQENTTKSKLVQLIGAVQTLLRKIVRNINNLYWWQFRFIMMLVVLLITIIKQLFKVSINVLSTS
ncbi:Yos1p [Kluyveromyces lactis]|uniref:KLLA0C07744p n=1 Tax=Kluyveromyces lactis (strain ATCC 8585 / CBS 2359 / DSM 70799 / NBRC 1267 / NRRL Y-1140 / WM37) TaxID=284590 RepID=B5FV60_KLULA|nr:uncharacterized protein KLLA0_C07744g [Kluyveromyces lactis]CAR64362.1 KLLA0C07744p [Kluyveromyces lactis]|eukprot:XP_002999358.1 uncharacterized protein KLLA0_C07744g [Kluyveromyces lactis]